ncbi:MAG: hypothetical protein K2R98_19275 [Gemmataceae bacterium]|nr:hypothetical protein [Gemmataceae bacterium]
MKARTAIIVAASIGCVLAFAATFAVVYKRTVDAQVESLSQIKYSARPLAGDLPVEIVGQGFEWRVRYPSSRRLQGDGKLAANFAQEANESRQESDDVRCVDELHVWKKAKIHVHLKSGDVPHTFSVPVLRLMETVAPGKVTLVWFIADRSNVTWDPEADDWTHEDSWEFRCAEHGPTKMKGQLLVHETKDDFLKWLRRAEKNQP